MLGQDQGQGLENLDSVGSGPEPGAQILGQYRVGARVSGLNTWTVFSQGQGQGLAYLNSVG